MPLKIHVKLFEEYAHGCFTILVMESWSINTRGVDIHAYMLVLFYPCSLHWRRMQLSHLDWVMHISTGKLTSIGSDNDLPPGRRQAVI